MLKKFFAGKPEILFRTCFSFYCKFNYKKHRQKASHEMTIFLRVCKLNGVLSDFNLGVRQQSLELINVIFLEVFSSTTTKTSCSGSTWWTT
jgi:hypothetical protein